MRSPRFARTLKRLNRRAGLEVVITLTVVLCIPAGYLSRVMTAFVLAPLALWTGVGDPSSWDPVPLAVWIPTLAGVVLLLRVYLQRAVPWYFDRE
jgi:hypothetical protein